MWKWLIFPLWLVLVLYWVVSGLTSRPPGAARWIWWREITLRLGLFALVMLVLELEAHRHVVPGAEPLRISRAAASGLVGLVVAAMGVLLAIAARRCRREQLRWPSPNGTPRELMTSGPYALIRHPLYGGLLLAMLGSAIAQSSLWLLPLLVYAPAFILSARREEQQLLQRFPEAYAAYRRRTKMLLPFLL